MNYISSDNNTWLDGSVMELSLSFSETHFLNFTFRFQFDCSMHLSKEEINLRNLLHVLNRRAFITLHCFPLRSSRLFILCSLWNEAPRCFIRIRIWHKSGYDRLLDDSMSYNWELVSELRKLNGLIPMKHLARWLACSKASTNASYCSNDYEAFYIGF